MVLDNNNVNDIFARIMELAGPILTQDGETITMTLENDPTKTASGVSYFEAATALLEIVEG